MYRPFSAQNSSRRTIQHVGSNSPSLESSKLQLADLIALPLDFLVPLRFGQPVAGFASTGHVHRHFERYIRRGLLEFRASVSGGGNFRRDFPDLDVCVRK